MSVDSRSHVALVVGTPDGNTRVGVPDVDPRLDRVRLDAFYREAVAAHRPEAYADGYALYWGREGELHRVHLAEGARAFAVVGRHSRCDVWLSHDGEISLRHLLARASRSPAGGIALDLLDLGARLPFHLADETPHRSATIEGPVAMRLGRYAVCALPTGPDVGAPPPELPPPVVAPASSPPPRPDAPPREASASVVAPRRNTSSIFAVPSRPERAAGALEVHRAERHAAAWLDRETLEAGVLVGRYRRCVDQGLRSLLGTSVSRTHLLVIGDGETITAYDLCSRNGTFVGERRVRQTRLDTRGARVALSRPDGVWLKWRPA